MLDGEEGPAVAKSMELLVALGEVFEADRLIPVKSAHISGVSYSNLGDAGRNWLKEQAEMGAKCRIKATLNPAGMDMEKWREMDVPEKFAVGQNDIVEQFRKMGVQTTCTCTPYLIDHIPDKGTQIAWAESNAVCYSNSVLGARTNRESGPSTLASAVTGLTPYYGYRLKDERRPDKVIDVKADLDRPLDYSALGYLTGKLLGNKVPFFKGIGKPSIESMKTLGAACATSGSIALWHGEEITPEAGWASQYLEGLETITLENSDLGELRDSLSSDTSEANYCIGCPHCTLQEIKEISEKTSGRYYDGNLWVFTSRGIYKEAYEAGYIESIEETGGRVYRDTCMVVAPLKDMGWSEISTNSFKGAHYSVAHGFPTKIQSLDDILLEASE